MHPSWTISTIACCGLWLLSASTAMAQGIGPYRSAATVGRDAFDRPAYSNSPVSPYVNLGTNLDGLSNYQTFVKPLLDEREARRMQSDTMQPSGRQTRNRRDARIARGDDSPPNSQSPVRFLHYSHFYGGIR